MTPGAAPDRWQGARDFTVWARANRVPWLAGAWILGLVAVAVLHRPDVTFGAARATYLVLALYGLQVLARDTGQPSLGQAAFLALGAYSTALLRLRAGLDGVTAAALLTVVGGVAGSLLGRGVTHLRPAFLALLTWSLGWGVYLGLAAIPEVSGGIAGISFRDPVRVRWDLLGVDLTLNDSGHLVMASVLLALVLLLYRSAQTSVIGLGWGALRDSPALASSLGYDVASTRRHAFAIAAGLATLAGSLGAQLLKVVDPTSYSPLQSLNLLAAVMIGAPLGFLGPLLGAAVTSGAPFLVDQVSVATGTPVGTGRELAAASIILAALALSARVGQRRAPAIPRGATGPVTPTAAPQPPTALAAGGSTALSAVNLHVDFDGVRALGGASLSLQPGLVHGLVGPNGSGKSTLLRCLAGVIPYTGTIRLGDEAIDGMPEFRRVRAGVARTFQRTAVMPHLAAREHVEAGLRLRSPDSGWAQALFRTPRYRREAIVRRRRALAVLADFGLEGSADLLPDALSGGHQRLLQIATAAATRPRALLLDEPAAGMDTSEREMLAEGIRRTAAAGVAVLLIEHNMAFLAAVAGRVTVLDSGEVLAEGTPAEVAANPAVRRAYLGLSSEPTPAPRTARRRRPRPRPAI